MPEYRIFEGSLQEKFFALRSKGQIFGGGYGNGKTAAVCIKAIEIGDEYPGANILIGRATYPQLMDTIWKEFLKWCPTNYIKRLVTSPVPNIQFTNGTNIDFRNLHQKGNSKNPDTTSNLLSATYDLVIIDQCEDPEIEEKDIQDLIGRLRGSAQYRGTDPTMPRTGPRWLLLTLNPTRNWCYHKLIKPLHDYAKYGVKTDDLYVNPATGEPFFELVEGSTYENKDNLPEDFIHGLEAMYRGQMRERYLEGKWAGYEGLVYPGFDPEMHLVDEQRIRDFVDRNIFRNEAGYRTKVSYLEGFDYGKSNPCCHLLGYQIRGTLVIVDGWYNPQGTDSTSTIGFRMLDYKTQNNIPRNSAIYCDPDIFRKNKQATGRSVAEQINGEVSLSLRRGENNIDAGITKVNSLLAFNPLSWDPIEERLGSPRILVNAGLQFFQDEILNYYYQKEAASGQFTDKPTDRNDHAMDTLKYMVTPMEVDRRTMYKPSPFQTMITRWHEMEDDNTVKKARYG